MNKIRIKLSITTIPFFVIGIVCIILFFNRDIPMFLRALLLLLGWIFPLLSFAKVYAYFFKNNNLKEIIGSDEKIIFWEIEKSQWGEINKMNNAKFITGGRILFVFFTFFLIVIAINSYRFGEISQDAQIGNYVKYTCIGMIILLAVLLIPNYSAKLYDKRVVLSLKGIYFNKNVYPFDSRYRFKRIEIIKSNNLSILDLEIYNKVSKVNKEETSMILGVLLPIKPGLEEEVKNILRHFGSDESWSL